jgi:SSS family solute:Na+ symporter
MFIVAGLVIYFPDAKAAAADNLVIEYILKFTNPVVASCVVGGLLSAAMSTAGGLLLLISSVFTQDLPKVLSQKQQDALSEEKRVFFGRIMVFVVLGVSYLISLRSLGQLVTMGIQLAYPGYLVALPAVIGGIWWKKGNGVGMTWGLITGLAAVYYTTYIDRNPLSIHSGLWGLCTCTIVYIAASLATKPNTQATLTRFGLADGQREEAATMDSLTYAAKHGKI